MRAPATLLACLILACGESADPDRALAPSADRVEPVGRAGSLEVYRPRTPRPAAGRTAALYLVIRNRGNEPDTLVALSTPAAASAMLHRSAVEDGMARMSAAGVVEVPPTSDLVLEPGGLHAMLMGLVAPLELGDTFDVTLEFAVSGALTLPVPVVSYADLESDLEGFEGGAR